MTYTTTADRLGLDYDTSYGRMAPPKGMAWAIVQGGAGSKPTVQAWHRTEGAAIRHLRRMAKAGIGRLHILHLNG